MPVSDHGALLRPPRLRGVELPVALFDAARPLVPGNGGADMVGASPLTCSGNFLLRLGELRVSPAGFAAELRGRPPDRAGAAASIGVMGVLAEAIFLARTPLL